MASKYAKFGHVLTTLRRRFHETKRELSMALELSEDELVKLEKGVKRPSEDLVEQVISHYELDDNMAQSMWLLAGYSQDDRLEELAQIQTALMPIAELKINYTDMVHVSVNNFGVVINFMQNGGPANQPVVVSRLGMSKEHALSVIDVLQRTILASSQKNSAKEPRALPSGENQ
jgi:DNA-binding XRE family transcriptional regulator